MACKLGQFDVVQLELMVNNQFKGLLVSIWMLDMWMEWLLLICTVIMYSRVYFSSAIRLYFETDNQTNKNLSRAAGECISAPRVRRNAISNVANVSSTTDTGLKNQRDLKEETFVSSTQQWSKSTTCFVQNNLISLQATAYSAHFLRNISWLKISKKKKNRSSWH